MADFRKWLLAFAAAALVLGTGASANAQNTAPFSCSASASNPPLVRAEGVTEEIGDVVLTCTGGNPTPMGTAIPLSNITITLNTSITDRIYNTTTGLSEALLMIDDPYPVSPDPNPPPTPSANSASTQLLCPATGGVNTCGITSTGYTSGHLGGDYDGQITTVAGVTYKHYNIFQGAVTSANQISFLGVPIDAPGSTLTVSIRLTNVRGNASQLTVGSQFSLSPIQMFIAVNGSQQIVINNPQPIVGYVTPGLITSVTGVTDEQCIPPSGFSLTFTENFASSFKARVFGDGRAANVPGFSYNSESGLWDTSGAIGLGGLADHGTRLLARFSGMPAGITLTVPAAVPLVRSGPTASGMAYYVQTDGYGNSAPGPISTSGSGNVTVTLDSTGAGWVTYEVVANDYTAVESVTIPVGVAYPAAPGTPGLGAGSVKLSFAPIPAPGTSGWTTASPTTANPTSFPIPRFVDTSTAAGGLTIVPCTCNLLFPFITNQLGFDTGIAIANTSLDPYGSVPQTGPITLNFYGELSGGTALTTAQATVTTPAVPAGCIYTMTLSGGGSVMNCANGPTGTVAPLAGFQGYLIAQSQFLYCHGFAFISAQGGSSLAEGYLGIELDYPGLTRTMQTGESKGN